MNEESRTGAATIALSLARFAPPACTPPATAWRFTHWRAAIPNINTTFRVNHSAMSQAVIWVFKTEGDPACE